MYNKEVVLGKWETWCMRYDRNKHKTHEF